MSTCVIGAFRYSAATLLEGMTVSISVRKQEETWGICLVSHSMEKLGFEPKSVYSICSIPLPSKRMSSLEACNVEAKTQTMSAYGHLCIQDSALHIVTLNVNKCQ